MRFISAVSISTILAFVSLDASAIQQSFFFSFSTQDNIFAAGIIQAEDTGLPVGDWLITSIDGQRDGLPMTLLAAKSFEGNNNIMHGDVYAPDYSGWSYSTLAGKFNLYLENPLELNECRIACPANGGTSSFTTAFSVSPVPEPSSIALLLLGFPLIVLSVKRVRWPFGN